MKKFAICVAMLVSAASVFSQAEKIKEAKKLAGGETPDFAKAISRILQQPTTLKHGTQRDSFIQSSLISRLTKDSRYLHKHQM